MRKFITSVLVFVVAFLTFGVTKASAAKILTNDKGTVTVAKGEVINDDVFIGAATAEVDGTINGDVFIGAQTVRVTGTVNGNLHIGAQNVMLTGANIKGSVITGGQTIIIDNTSVIGGSIMAGGENVTIDSQVKRNVFVGTGVLSIGDNARVGRDLFYASNQATISSKAKITGSVFKSEAKAPQAPQVSQKQVGQFMTTAKIFSSIISYLGLLIIGLIFIKFPHHFPLVVGKVTNSFWKSLGVGFLAIIALVPALIILAITVIGIPLAGLILLIFILFSFLSKIVVGAAIGNWISEKAHWKINTFWPFALGLLIIYILKIIPIAGGLFGFVVMLVGIGALVLQVSSKTE